MDAIVECHPPPVVTALLRGVLSRDGGIAVHLAAMLHFLHGCTAEPFDLDRRSFYLRFHTSDRAEREDAFRALCADIGVDPEPHLSAG